MLLQGNEACVRGALYAGCRFYAGYPITPSSEIMEQMASELPRLGGVFVQMEDEIGSIAAVIGASWAGAKAMTATSGPGLTLMLENIGYGIMTETPCVVVDVQRAGPSTGQATKPASGDVMQLRWGASGDYEIIALSPWSVLETYELTIRAFNLAETYRLPVFLASDAAIGHLKENVALPKNLKVTPRAKKSKSPVFSEMQGKRCLPVPMPAFGQGRGLMVTGSTHDEWGYRRTQSPTAHSKLVSRFCRKISDNADKIAEWETYYTRDADTVVVAYGFTARSALRAVNMARGNGKHVGLLRFKTLWPFGAKALEALPKKVKRIVVPEMNQGQLEREIRRFIRGKIGIIPYHKTDGTVITPREILGVL
ncbi:MAG: 2-oxoacid:acceptor oxidoreductase subunit alpha [Planctomycetes bacterium]|nr:2-oxoacid:acceptor oxidoreductase subunit alpha [Planctomycetota bacterium]